MKVTYVNEKDILLRAMRTYGSDAQALQLIEECSELIAAMVHFQFRSSKTHPDAEKNLIAELADVEIMCSQMRMYFRGDEIDAAKTRKLIRLEERLNETDELKGGE